MSPIGVDVDVVVVVVVDLDGDIAEGAGEFSRDEKQRFYRLARRSATETAAILDILDRRQAVAASVLAPALELLERVVAMLARLAGA